MVRYDFPKVTADGEWYIALYKVEVYLEGTGITVGSSRTDDAEHFYFSEELTSQQLTDITAILADADILEPTYTGLQETGTQIFVIEDKFGRKEWFDAWFESMGFSGPFSKAMMFPVESDPVGSPGVYDQIHIKFTKLLTSQDKKAVEDAAKVLYHWLA